MNRVSCLVGFAAALATGFGNGHLQAGPVTLVDKGATWFFLDDGSDQGTVWRAGDFDHVAAGWESGPAPLGYGDLGDPNDPGAYVEIATPISYGGDDQNKHTTTYFRHRFEVDAADLENFTYYTLGLLRDDGAAVYLNGTEVGRDTPKFNNLKPNAAFDDFAENTVNVAEEILYFESAFLPGSLLHAGTNTVAVEVHQINATSTDVGMDLYLIGNDVPIEFGEVTPNIFTGFEEADAGDTSFARDVGDTELEWAFSGTAGIASVDATFTDPNDPNNLHQFHVNQAANPVQITSELIDVRDFVDLQISVDLRTFLDSGTFEDDDSIQLGILASTDGFSFSRFSWLQLAGAELDAQDNGLHGGLNTFASPAGFIPDDVATLRVLLETRADSQNEHVVFDNIQVTGVVLTEMLWDGDDANWGQVTGDPPKSHWSGGDPDAIPDESTVAVINGGTATVEADHVAYRLDVNGGGVIVDNDQSLSIVRNATLADGTTLAINDGAALDAGGPVSIGSGCTLTLGTSAALTVGGELNVASGTTLDVGPSAAVSAGGGSVDSLVTRGDATITSGGDLVVTTFADTVSGTLAKLGDGTLWLDNSAAAPGSVAAANTSFRIEAGMLKSKGADPLGGSISVTLAGGLLSVEHDAALNLSGTAVTLSGDSTLEAITPADAAFGKLLITAGTLTTTGSPDGIRFNPTTLDPAMTATDVGFRAMVETNLGPVDGSSLSVTITKSGPADLVLSENNVGLDNATFVVEEGRLIGVHGSSPFGKADIRMTGGDLVLSAKSGAASPVVFDNAVTVEADGALTVGPLGGAAGPMNVILGSPRKPLAVNSGTLLLRTTDGYRLHLAARVGGAGGLELAEGEVSVDNPLSLGSLILSGGTLVRGGAGTPDGDVNLAEALTLSGSSLDMSGSTLRTTTATAITVGTGQTLTIENQNLVADSLELAGTLVRKGTPGDIVVGTSLTLDTTLDMTGAALLTTPGVTDITVNAGGRLTVDHLLTANVLDVFGTVSMAGAHLGDLNVKDGGTVNVSDDVIVPQGNTVDVEGGALHLNDDADLLAWKMHVAGGTVNTSTNQVIVTEELTLADTVFTVTGGTVKARGADLLDLPNTDFVVGAVVSADAEFSSPAGEVILGDLTLEPGVAGLTLTNAAYSFNNLNAADGATIEGELVVRGTISPGLSGGQLTVEGLLELSGEPGASPEYLCELDGPNDDDRDLIAVIGDCALAGKLSVEVLSQLGDPGRKSRTIITAEAGTITGEFTEKASTGDYLGYGVFLSGQENTGNAYDLTLLQALAGDTDGDGDVDPSDLAALVQNWAPAGTDKSWREGNFDDDQDGNVDPSDLSALVQNWAPAGYLPEGAPPAAGSAAVPEPSALVLLAMAALVLSIAGSQRGRRGVA